MRSSVRQWDARAHAHARSGSAYLIVKARHALRHLCQNNINGRHARVCVTLTCNTSARARRGSLSIHTHTHARTQHVSMVKVAGLRVRASDDAGCSPLCMNVSPHVRAHGHALCVSGRGSERRGGEGRGRQGEVQAAAASKFGSNVTTPTSVGGWIHRPRTITRNEKKDVLTSGRAPRSPPSSSPSYGCRGWAGMSTMTPPGPPAQSAP